MANAGAMSVVKAFGPPELSFVRASMRALAGGREGCAHCHRTPLMGETIYRYGDRFVCELCRPLRAAMPDRSVLVRSPEQAGLVRSLPLRP